MEKDVNVLVVGGGIAGMQASLDLADRGFKVYLVEKTPSIGGRMAQLDKTFPTMDCSICILAPKMIDVNRRQNIKLLTYSEVKEVNGEPGNFNVKILKKSRFVDAEKCTGCGECIEVCPVTAPREFDMGLGVRKAIYRPFPQAVPNIFVIDKKGIPPCRAACPAGVNAQGYIALITQGKFNEALELIRRDIPFPGVCGRICYHPCEAECERGKVDEAVAINALKRFTSDYELKNEKKKKVAPIPKAHTEKIAIIGSGPSGLTAAYELVKKGYPVTVLEALPKPGGMLRVGIPEYRLPKKILDTEIEHIKDLGVEIQTNISIGKDLMFKELLQKFDATFIATGMHKGVKLGVDGEELKGVVNAIDFLREVNLGKKVELGDRVAVICVHRLLTIDAARVALRLGPKEVNVIYRRSRQSMLHHERIGEQLQKDIEEVESEGAKIHVMIWPTKILGKDGRVVGIECARMTLGEPDEHGKRRLVPIKGSEFIMEVDSVIIAVGQAPDFSFLPKEVELTEKNTIKVDPVTLETSLPGVFAGGEVESGPSTAIASIATGKRAAVSIDRYLRSEDLKVGREKEIKLVEEVPKEGVEKKARQVMPILPVEKRIRGFDEIETGFTEEMALQEAERCLKCGGCSECLECEKACEPKAVMHDQKEEYVELNVGAIILATGFNPFNPSGIKEYGYGKYKNVLNSMELERLLSASGPTSGKLARPSDNKIAHKVAFIQCVGSRSLKGEYPYCSSVCCMYATKEAALIKEHERESEVYIFYTDIRAFGKGFREFVNRARKEWGIEYFRAKPSEIREDPKTRDLLIKYEDTLTGEMHNLQVDLVVLCTALVPPQDNQNLAETLGVKVDEYGFFEVQHRLQTPLDATAPGIFLCGCCQGPKDIPDSIAQAKGAAARAAEFIAQAGSMEASR
jgi:heterodisulfide reductase subunit A-like polyferredoxin